MTSNDPQATAPHPKARRRRRSADGPRRLHLTIKFSTDEAALIRQAAQRLGLAVGAWIGEMLAQQCDPDTEQLLTWEEILDHLLAFRRDVVRVRTNIDQLAKVAGAAGEDDRWIRHLAEVTDRILGRNDDMANHVATQLGQQRSR